MPPGWKDVPISLKKKTITGAPPLFYSRDQTPGKPPGTQQVLEAITASRVITEGHITPKMPKELCIRLQEQTNTYDIEALCKSILCNCGFDASGFDLGRLLAEPVCVNQFALKDSSGRFIGDKRQVQYAMLLQAMQIVLLSYGDKKRLSENFWASHPLRAGAFAAAIGAPIEIVISSLLHDILEDSLDQKLQDVKYRAYSLQGGKPVFVKYGRTHSILVHIRENFWIYGRKIARDVECVTRPEKPNGNWQHDYEAHITRAHSRIGSAFAKGSDSVVNLQELEVGSDDLEMASKLLRKLLKVDCKIPFWTKLSWVMAEVLLFELKEKSLGTEYEGIEKAHRFITTPEIIMFERGFNMLSKSHSFTPGLVKNLSRSRSPIIDIYTAKPEISGAAFSYRFEFPFMQDKEKAFSLVQGVFGKDLVSELKRASSLLPSRLTDAVIVQAHFASDIIISKVIELQQAYDAELQHILAGGFDRKRMAQAARERRNRLMAESSSKR